jgi:steroid 5-alpha reductase family enzyme
VFDVTHGLLALGLICGLALATWVASLWRRDVSIVDGMWSVFIGGAGGLYAWLAAGVVAATTAARIALVLLAVWAVRLCLHIVVRNHGNPEDRRYQQIRANHQPNFELKSLYIVFGLQAALAWIVALPFMAIVLGDAGLWALAGLGLAAFGIVFETVADAQLARFTRRGDHHGRVLDTGLWRYSRHPNYFGECCVWWGFGIMAVAAGAWWALASPLLMTVLLLKVSGVALLEKDIGARRPAYARYVRQTSAFIPWPPLKGDAPNM